MVNISDIQNHVVSMLSKGLSPKLIYHNVDHTLDVTKQCIRIAKSEGITDKEVLQELEIAALYHDTGFLFVYINHEEKSCELAKEQLPHFGVNKKSIENICSIIMATKIPQSPKNYLQQIICDADLDYLGRNDFLSIGEKLRKELMEYKLVSSREEWEDKQITFLQSHHYFTKTSLKNREPVKLKNLHLISDFRIKKGE